MQEWIIAMLAVSILLILRDMAKTVLKGRKSKKEEPFPMNGEHPQKERVERYAASFQKLADTFYGMPYKKEYLSSAQVENVLREAGEHLCRTGLLMKCTVARYNFCAFSYVCTDVDKPIFSQYNLCVSRRSSAGIYC